MIAVNECLQSDKCQPQAWDREDRLQGKRHQQSKMRKKSPISICKENWKTSEIQLFKSILNIGDNMPKTWCTCTSVSTEIIWINKTYCKIPGLWLVILVVLHLGHKLEGNHPKGECDNCYRSQDDCLKLLHRGRVRFTPRKDQISWTIK